MSIARLVLPSLLAAALLSAPLAADVLVVRADGAGDFTSFSAAASAALDGDILLLQDDFPDDEVLLNDKGLVIVSDAGSAHQVGRIRVLNLAAGKSVVLRGLEIGPRAPGSGTGGSVDLGSCLGAVLVEDCVVYGREGQQGAFDVNGLAAVTINGSPEVAIVRSTLIGGDGVTLVGGGFPGISPVGWGGAGLFVGLSTVSVYASTLVGGDGSDPLSSFPGGNGGAGLLGFACEVWVEGGLVQGGVGGIDCLEQGDGCEGGPGASLISPFPFFFEDGLLLRRDVQLDGGAGGALKPPAMGTGFAGEELQGASVDYPGAATFAAEAGPLREGDVGTFSVFGPPGAQAAWMFSFDFGFQRLGGNKGVLGLDFPLFGPYLMGAISGSGVAQFNYVNPSLAGSGLDGLLLAKQALVLDGDGLRFTGPSAYIHVGTTP